MAKLCRRVWKHGLLRDAGLVDRVPEAALEALLVEVVSGDASGAGRGVAITWRNRSHPSNPSGSFRLKSVFMRTVSDMGLFFSSKTVHSEHYVL